MLFAIGGVLQCLLLVRLALIQIGQPIGVLLSGLLPSFELLGIKLGQLLGQLLRDFGLPLLLLLLPFLGLLSSLLGLLTCLIL